MADDSSEYERGHLAGEVSARLAGHDAHFAAINGSIDRLGVAVEQLNTGIQRLVERDLARDVRWTPLQKVIASIGAALTAVASITGAIVVVAHH